MKNVNPEQFEEFERITKELLELSKRKNHDYGSENIGILGTKGVYVRIWDKVARLKRLLWDDKDAQVKDETLEDTVKDLCNYGIILIILLRNKWGK